MWDASGTGPAPAGDGPRAGARQAPVSAKVAGGSLSIVPDATLLADPETVYPLAIVPPDYSVGVSESGWAKVASGKSGTSYWWGGVDGSEAKIGYCGWTYCNGMGELRSYFQYDHGGFLFGKNIISARFNARNFYSPSCSPREVALCQTTPVDAGTNWNNQPWKSESISGGLVNSHNVAYGYSGTCPPNYVGYDLTDFVRGRVWNGWTVLTYVLTARYGGDEYAWKKFDWNPTLVVHYNTPPNTPGSLSTNGRGCASSADGYYSPTATPRMSAAVSDPDGGQVQAEFEWWHAGGLARVGAGLAGPGSSGSTFSYDIPAGAFQHGSQIGWRVHGGDGRDESPWSPWCCATIDTVPPRWQPAVSSTDYPECREYPNCPFGGAPGRTGTFRLAADTAASPADTDPA